MDRQRKEKIPIEFKEYIQAMIDKQSEPAWIEWARKKKRQRVGKTSARKKC